MKRTPLSVLILFLVGCFVTGCKKPALPPPQVPIVYFVPSISKEVVEWDEYIGRLESPKTVEIRPRVSGYLNKVHFQEGKEVNQGDILFTIDRRPYQAEFDRAEAEHLRASNQAELAKNEADRAKKLIATRVISEEDLDTKAKAYSAAQAAEKAAQATKDLAKLNLEFTEIHAPISGRISRALVTEGNLVSGGPNSAVATLLTTVVSQDPLYLYGDADERAILKYVRLSREGKRDSARDKQIPAEMALADDIGFPHKGYMDFVDNRVDPGTGTLRARGVFPNPDHRLSPGLFGRIRIPGSGKYQAVLIPDRTVGSDQTEKFVYVITAEQKVEYRPVKIGPLIEGLRVVKEGLKPDERVIAEGLLRVRPGMTVNAKPLEKLEKK
jgi:RND family efflux transporter MFP subunit